MFRFILLSLVLSSLIGCSGTLYVYKENLKLLFKSPAVVSPDRAYVAASQYDIIQVNIADKQAIMALAFVEQGQDKFISADNGFVIFANGRIVRTAGFIDNLLHVHNLTADPLKQSFSVLGGRRWQYVEQTNTLTAKVNSAQFNIEGQRVLTLLNSELTTVLLSETVHPENEDSFVNFYWFDETSGELIKTKQHPANMTDAVTVTFLSRVNRILSVIPGESK